MNNILKGLGWAALIIAVALAGNAGLLTEDMSRTLIIVLPVLAVLTLRDNASPMPCPLFGARGRQ